MVSKLLDNLNEAFTRATVNQRIVVYLRNGTIVASACFGSHAAVCLYIPVECSIEIDRLAETAAANGFHLDKFTVPFEIKGNGYRFLSAFSELKQPELSVALIGLLQSIGSLQDAEIEIVEPSSRENLLFKLGNH